MQKVQTSTTTRANSSRRSGPIHLDPEAFLAVFKTACTQPAVRQNPTLSLEISELLHHYIEVSVPSMVPLTIDILKRVWIEVILPDAQRHQFMMDAVYGLAAFHLAYLVPCNSVKYANMAHRYHGRSLGTFQTAVTHVTPDNACAVLCFAFFQFIISLASPFSFGPSHSDEVIDSMHASLVAARGFLGLQPMISPHIGEGMVAAWLRLDKTYPEPPSGSARILALVDGLERVNKASFFPRGEKAICLKAIKLLHVFFSTVPFDPFEWQVLFTWPAVLPEEFLGLIRERHPIALITMLHWFLPICHESRQRWILSRWEKPLVHSVLRSVGPFWAFAIADLVTEHSQVKVVDNVCRSVSQLAITERCLAQNEENEVEVPELPVYLVHPEVKNYMSQHKSHE